MLLPLSILGFFLIPPALAFNWSYPVAPRQCSNFTVNVTGEIVFPLKVLIVPVGLPPVFHEVRSVLEIAFPTDATAVTFQLPYPAESKFVGLVSDASGYRGTATTWTVLSSEDASCFVDVQDAISPFNFSTSTAIAECRDVRIYWDAASVNGNPSFLAVIPDGPFLPIPPGKMDTQPRLGTGFTWTPAIRARTNLIIVGGDNRGMGSGGFINTFVDPGDPSRDDFGDCPAPSATASSIRTPYPPITQASIGGIVAGVLGGVIFISSAIAGAYLLHQKKAKPQVMSPGMEKGDLKFSYYGGSVDSVPPYSSPNSLPAYTKDSGIAA